MSKHAQAAAPYQLLPVLSVEAYATLRADIMQRGIQVPVELDEAGHILDGHHRVQIADELGLTYPTLIRHGLTHQEKVHHVLSLNLHRRHLTREQRITLEKRLRDEGMTYTQIADAVNVDPATVQRDTATLAFAKVAPDTTPEPDAPTPDRFTAPAPPEPPRIVGKDGKARPAVYQPRKPTFGHTKQEAEKRADYGIILSSASQEWYTPARYIEAARAVLGAIDVDPASSVLANQTVQAARFYTAAENGLAYQWPGHVWLNPPYSRFADAFIARLVQQYDAGITTEAIILISAHSTDTERFKPLWDYTLCFTDHRINFATPGGKGIGSTHGSVFVYFGPDPLKFKEAFQQFGAVVIRL